jgi:ankyrin repeat protein
MASITSLPNELVVFVLENLNSQRDIARLCRVNRKLHDAVSPFLYKNAVDRHDMWPLAFAAFSGNASTMRKILAAGADPNWLFDETNMPREVFALLLAPSTDRIPEPQNTPFGLGQPAQIYAGYGQLHPPLFGGHGPWSRASSDMSDDDLDEDDIEFLTAGDLDVWDAWTGLPLGEDMSGSDLDGLGDDVSEHDSSLPGVSSTDSSTLGSNDRPQNGAVRDHTSPVSRFFTTLHLAAGMGNDEAVQLLLDHGASIDAGCRRLCGCKCAEGMLNNMESPQNEVRLPQWTPLHVAICLNRPDTARLLLSRGASCMMETPRPSGVAEQYDSTALHHAAALGQVDLVKYLVEAGHQTDIDVRDRRTLTPFYYAYANGRWESTIPSLLQMGADINVEIKFYQPYCTITPLGEAVRLGNFEDALKLLELGADPSHGFVATGAGHRNGLSPLHLGCMPSARPSGGSPKLFDEARKAVQRIKIMEAFIAKGADIHSTDCYGDTALISAVQNRVLPSVRVLIAAGADVNARNSLGRTVTMQAVLGPSKPPPHSLVDGHVSIPDSIRVLSDILSELVKAGARVDDVDPNGNNMLHLLLESVEPTLPPGITDVTHVIRLLLTYPGADALLTARNKEGQLAFELAFNAGVVRAYDVLLRPGLVQRVLTPEDLQRMCKFVMREENMDTDNVELLLDLDVGRKLLSGPALFREAVINDCWSVVAHIARRGIPPLDRETCTELLWYALDAFHWDLAYQFVVLGADVNAARDDGTGTTPLRLVVDVLPETDYSRVERLIQILVDKGANIHHSQCGASHSRLLTKAIEQRRAPLVQVMLRNQPLREDPRAVGGCYLHHALRLVPPPGSYQRSPQPRMVYALIHSGADLTELDQDDDYPLAVLLRGLCALAAVAQPQDVQFFLCCDLLKDLFVPALQISKPNKKGRSIVDYLEEFLQTKAGRLWLAPKLELVASGGAKILRFKPDMRLKRMPDDRPVTTIWDTYMFECRGAWPSRF